MCLSKSVQSGSHLAEMAGQPGKMVEQLNPNQPNQGAYQMGCPADYVAKGQTIHF